MTCEWWLMLVVPATQEAEVRGLQFKIDLDKKHDILSEKELK
jgi:hypothetical protein